MIARNESKPTPDRVNPLNGVFTSLADLAGDLLELTELQIQLAKVDGRRFLKQSIPLTVIGVMAATSVIATLPVMMMGLAKYLSVTFGWQEWIGLLGVAGVTGMVSLALLFFCISQLRKTLTSFKLSYEQSQKNVAWMKNVIRGEREQSADGRL